MLTGPVELEVSPVGSCEGSCGFCEWFCEVLCGFCAHRTPGGPVRFCEGTEALGSEILSI